MSKVSEKPKARKKTKKIPESVFGRATALLKTGAALALREAGGFAQEKL